MSTQLLPSADYFAETELDSGTVFTGQVCMYWPATLWNQTVEVATGAKLRCASGKLASITTYPKVATSVTDPADPTDYLNAFIYRDSTAADCEVFGAFHIGAMKGSPNRHSFRCCGVGARVVECDGTEITDGATYATVTAPEGYYFLAANRTIGSVAELRFFLLHITTASVGADATIRVLARSAVPVAPASFPVESGSVRMRLTVSGTGTDVVLTCLVNGSSVLTVTDTHASRTTATGHPALLLGNESLRGTNLQTVHLCSYFGMDKLGGDAHLFQDNWERSTNIHLLAVTPQVDDTATLLSSAYTGDRDGDTDFQYRIVRDSVSANERLSVVASPLGGLFLDRKPVEDPMRQGRILKFEFGAGGNALSMEAGVLVRGSFGADANMQTLDAIEKSGYMAVVRCTDGTVWTAEVLRLSHGEVETIATVDIPGTPALGTEYSLGLEAINVGNPDKLVSPIVGTVALQVRWLGSPVVTYSSPAAGIRIQGPYLIDSTSRRLHRGGQQGFYLMSDHATESVYATEFVPVGGSFF